jgi:hypothetical protein
MYSIPQHDFELNAVRKTNKKIQVAYQERKYNELVAKGYKFRNE